MKRLAFVALLFIVPLTAFAASAPMQAVIVMTTPGGHFSAKSLSTSFDPTISADERDVREFTAIHGFAANLTSDEIASLKASGNVVSIEPDFERHALFDSVTAGQQTIPYGVTAIDAPTPVSTTTTANWRASSRAASILSPVPRIRWMTTGTARTSRGRSPRRMTAPAWSVSHPTSTSIR
jgi:hypothetical protein